MTLLRILATFFLVWCYTNYISHKAYQEGRSDGWWEHVRYMEKREAEVFSDPPASQNNDS